MANLLIISTLILALGWSVNSLNVKDFHDIRHSEIDPEVDTKWMGSVKTWYVPMWSKLYRAVTVADVLEKTVSDLTEEEWNTRACGVFDGSNMYNGFNRKTAFQCKPNMAAEGHLEGITCKAPWSGAKTVDVDFELTDNKDFIFGVKKEHDGEGSWVVLSTTPKLKEEDKQRILHKIKAFGFKDEMIHFENYNGCPKVEL